MLNDSPGDTISITELDKWKKGFYTLNNIVFETIKVKRIGLEQKDGSFPVLVSVKGTVDYAASTHQFQGDVEYQLKKVLNGEIGMQNL